LEFTFLKRPAYGGASGDWAEVIEQTLDGG